MSAPTTHAPQSGNASPWEISRGVYIGTLWLVIAALIVIGLVAGSTVDRNEKGEFAGIHHALDNPSNVIAVVGAGIGIFGTVVGYFGSRQRRIIVHRVIGMSYEPEEERNPSTETGGTEPSPDPEEEPPAGAGGREAPYERLDAHAKTYLGDYFTGLTAKIYARAVQVANEDGRNNLQTRDIAQACTEIAPGNLFPPTFWQRITSSISGITVISAALAIIFGGIAALNLVGDENVKAFIDIAQVFAGAVVGSTGAAAVSGIGTATGSNR